MFEEKRTIEYKDKISAEYEARIAEMLSHMPSFMQDYNRFLNSSCMVKTRREYMQDIYNFFLFLKEKNPVVKDTTLLSTDILASLNGFDFDDYMLWMDGKTEKEKVSPVTKKRRLAAVRSLYKFLYKRDYISCNPSEKAISPTIRKKKRSDIRVLEKDESIAFLEVLTIAFDDANGKIHDKKESGAKIGKYEAMAPYLVMRDKAIIYLFLGTGLRVSELCAINLSDIVWDMSYINVIRKEDMDGSGSDRSDKVYFSEEVRNVLLEYINNGRDKIGADNNNYDALFISSKHCRITPRAIELMVKGYAESALGKGCGITPHKLRATFGTRYYAMTKDLSATSTVMNHSSIEVTAAYYLQEDREAKEKAMDMKI